MRACACTPCPPSARAYALLLLARRLLDARARATDIGGDRELSHGDHAEHDNGRHYSHNNANVIAPRGRSRQTTRAQGDSRQLCTERGFDLGVREYLSGYCSLLCEITRTILVPDNRTESGTPCESKRFHCSVFFHFLSLSLSYIHTYIEGFQRHFRFFNQFRMK